MRFRPLHAALAATLALGLAGCAPAITSPNTGDTDQTDKTLAPKVTTTYAEADKVYTTMVDATSETAFIYFDLDTQKEVTPADPATDTTWDLAFQSTTVLSNSGVSGKGDMRVARLAGSAFDSVTEAPTSGYKTDAADGDDSNSIVDSAFLVDGAWYSYNMGTHKISAHENVVYVVQSTEGKFYKLAFTSYYDAAGTSRFPKFKWAELPSPFKSLRVAGGSSPTATGWKYLNLSTGAEVTPATPGSSTDWDLAFNGYRVMTNSALSGAADGGAFKTDKTSLVDVNDLPSGTFLADATSSVTVNHQTQEKADMPYNPAFDAWYNYDRNTHAVTSKKLVYVVRLANGNFATVQFLDYADGKYGVTWRNFEAK